MSDASTISADEGDSQAARTAKDITLFYGSQNFGNRQRK